jgi:hypothetical protein
MVTGFTVDITFNIGLNANSYEDAEEVALGIGKEIQEWVKHNYPIAKDLEVKNIKANLIEDLKKN